jgi:hypothetical protein
VSRSIQSPRSNGGIVFMKPTTAVRFDLHGSTYDDEATAGILRDRTPLAH